MSGNKSILVCQCAERHLLKNVDGASGAVPPEQLVVVPDLCTAAATKDPLLEKIASGDSPVVYACHPRAVRALFSFAGHPLPVDAELINLRDPSIRGGDTPSAQSDPAWFPVIDYDRCTSCGQCFEFCLFGVYEKDDEGRVRVPHPSRCKNNCPACARICPETAIIFPKVGESPINGADISDEDVRRANVKINVDEILGDDVYATLNARKQKRQSLLKQKKIEKAFAERKQCSEEN